ncbi:MAG: alpha-galactosidase [Bifidobacterium aquikefiri]
MIGLLHYRITAKFSRQSIQRWTVQHVAPEYIGAHISQPSSKQTGRTFSLGFRAATAVFYSFGIEWDITTASQDDLDELAAWITWYKEHREFLHGGNYHRFDIVDPSVTGYGVVSNDGSRAIIAHVQEEESPSNRGSYMRIAGLDPQGKYCVQWTGPEAAKAALESLDPYGPFGKAEVSGSFLESVGIRMPRCNPETIRLFEIRRVTL